MGFKLNREYVILFEGTSLEGAEVRFRATPVDVALKLWGEVPYEEMAALMSEYLVEWNLEDKDGNPIGTTPEEITAHLEMPHMRRIAREWTRAASGITAPLDQPSRDGTPYPVESIPMEAA